MERQQLEQHEAAAVAATSMATKGRRCRAVAILLTVVLVVVSLVTDIMDVRSLQANRFPAIALNKTLTTATLTSNGMKTTVTTVTGTVAGAGAVHAAMEAPLRTASSSSSSFSVLSSSSAAAAASNSSSSSPSVILTTSETSSSTVTDLIDDTTSDYRSKGSIGNSSAGSSSQGNNRANTNNNGRSFKPQLILHVGPPKTGTTTIQYFLQCHKDDLMLDGFKYLGKFNRKGQCSTHGQHDYTRGYMQARGLPKKLKDMNGDKIVKEIVTNLRNNVSVILSDEGFPNHFQDNKVQHLLQQVNKQLPSDDSFEVVVAIAYRRYYDWLLSLYHFSYTPSWYDKKIWSKWPTPHTVGGGGDKNKEKASKVPTIQEYVSSKLSPKHIHPTAKIQNLFAPERLKISVPIRIVVLNLHGVYKDVMIEFLCNNQNIPALNKNTCGAYLQTKKTDKEKGVLVANQGKYGDTTEFLASSDYELLAYKAWEGGLIGKNTTATMKRNHVVDLFKQAIPILYNNTVPPMDCLSTQQREILLNKSLLWEQNITDLEFYNSKLGESALRQDFISKTGGKDVVGTTSSSSSSDRDLFCSVDYNSIFYNSSELWRPFMDCFNQEHRGTRPCPVGNRN